MVCRLMAPPPPLRSQVHASLPGPVGATETDLRPEEASEQACVAGRGGRDGVTGAGITAQLEGYITEAGIECVVFDQVEANPTMSIVITCPCFRCSLAADVAPRADPGRHQEPARA